MPGRPRAGRLAPRRDLTLKQVYFLVKGRDWHFDRLPAFADDEAAMLAYQPIRPLLLEFCLERFGLPPWIEGLYMGREVRPAGATIPGFTYESCRQFLAGYAQHGP